MSAKESKWRDNARIIWTITAKDIAEAIRNKNTLTVIITSLLMLLVYRGLPVLESRGEPPNVLVYDTGQSALVAFMENSPSVKVYTYPTEEEMKQHLANGDVPELGLVIPPDFDQTIEESGIPELRGYVMNWVSEAEIGELKDTIETEIARLVGVPIQIKVQGNIVYPQPDSGGMGVNAGFGFIFIITMIGLSMVPHLMLEEKHSRTMDALLVSPAGEWQVVTAKALTGLVYGLLASAVAIIVNFPVIVHWWLILLALLCGSLFTIAIGLLLGTLVENRGQLTLLAWVFIVPLLIPIFLYLLDDLVPAAIVKIARLIPTVVTFNLLRASFAGEFPLVPSLLQLIWVTALAWCTLMIVAWLVRRRDRETSGSPGLWRLTAGWISRLADKGASFLQPVSTGITRGRPSQESNFELAAEISPSGSQPQVISRGSNQNLRIIQAIALKDIGSAIKNKIILSIILGTALVVVNGSVLPWFLNLRAKPTAIVFDEGRSTIVRALVGQEEFRLGIVDSLEEMETAISGAPEVRLGLVIPADFDQRAGSGQEIELQGYFAHWADQQKVSQITADFEGQLGLATWGTIRIDTTGNVLYPTIDTGGQLSMTSLMMFIVILTIGMALVPLLFIEEKEAHTFEALLISPANLRQVVTGKALAGLFYCLSAAAVVILINRYLIVHWSAVILAAVLGAAFSVALGLILGFISDNQATTGLWGGALIVCLIALTVLESLQAGEWPALIQNILHWQPGSTLMRLFQISMAGDVPPGLLWTNAAALLAAAGLVYALFFGMLSRTEN